MEITKDFIEAFDRKFRKNTVGKSLDNFMNYWINCDFEIANGYCKVITKKEKECIAIADFLIDHYDNKTVVGVYF